ncbi:non-homologous end joining protein Ku [Limobrevibacterium gyesilva]|uniref:Non-homologous end joining protein Ku n=1 Tax=Limobrevibacterium gyesilva TaxID=2991712 RepID=A0AA42CE68_9PROT|nr:Ku protein [Limobrevibacterium gyesilva]MCW3474889.1 Ku protein [Limobrevibacterium gyesilva]
MADQRPIWRGHLRLALVSCPVALYSAQHDSGSLHFNLINPKTGNRIRMISQDVETGEELARGDLVKGYEYKKDSYIILTEEDFETARVDSSSTMKIGKFVKAGAIDPIYFDASYYLAADDKSGQDVYKVLWEAIRDTGMAALSRVVIARRERPVAILPLGDGLVAHTLHEQRDLNSPKALFEDMAGVGTDPEMIKLATQLIDRQAGKYDPADFEDRYETRLRGLIDARLKGEGIEAIEEDEDGGSNVIDLMTTLKRSLGRFTGEESSQKGPALRPKRRKAPASKGKPRPSVRRHG